MADQQQILSTLAMAQNLSQVQKVPDSPMPPGVVVGDVPAGQGSETPEQQRRRILSEHGFAAYDPHRGGYGICAPTSEAGDQRALISRPFGTIAHILDHEVLQGVPSVLTGIFTPPRSKYVILQQGRGDVGTDVGIDDPLSEAETSFYSDSGKAYPFRDYDFMLHGIAVVPDGQVMRPGWYSAPVGYPTASPNDKAVVSLGLGQQGFTSKNLTWPRGAAIPEIASGLLTPLAVQNFFMCYSLALGFKNESADWELGVSLMHPGGLGIFNGTAPTNADPVTGKYIPLPFAVQLPRGLNAGVSAALFTFTRDLLQSVEVDPTQLVWNGSSIFTQGPQPPGPEGIKDWNAIVQLFRVMLIGKRKCDPCSAPDVQAIMAALKCDKVMAESLAKAMQK